MLQQSSSIIAVTKSSEKLQRLSRPVPLSRLHTVLVTSSGFRFVPSLLKLMGVLSFGWERNGKDNLCNRGPGGVISLLEKNGLSGSVCVSADLEFGCRFGTHELIAVLFIEIV